MAWGDYIILNTTDIPLENVDIAYLDANGTFLRKYDSSGRNTIHAITNNTNFVKVAYFARSDYGDRSFVMATDKKAYIKLTTGGYSQGTRQEEIYSRSGNLYYRDFGTTMYYVEPRNMVPGIPEYGSLDSILAAMDDGIWEEPSPSTPVSIPVQWNHYGKIYEASFEITVT